MGVTIGTSATYVRCQANDSVLETQDWKAL